MKHGQTSPPPPPIISEFFNNRQKRSQGNILKHILVNFKWSYLCVFFILLYALNMQNKSRLKPLQHIPLIMTLTLTFDGGGG